LSKPIGSGFAGIFDKSYVGVKDREPRNIQKILSTDYGFSQIRENEDEKGE
jgi:hypothetical protein